MRTLLTLHLRRFRLLVAAACFLAPLSHGQAAETDEAAKLEFFETKIRPVLVEHCYQCHSSEGESIQGGLRVDFRAGLQAGGDSGAAVTPGKPDASLILDALRYDGLEMPPNGQLPAAVVRDFEHWIRAGAVDPRQQPAGGRQEPPAIDFAAAAEFWAFQPIRPLEPPAVAATGDAALKPIDRFLLARLEPSGLTMSPPADRRTLLRRACFDLIGLPPTPEQVEAFVNDSRADAFDHVVEELLASPHYGERWGRRWLDVARYGEDQAHTFKARRYPRGYLYRDWVVDALNRDMPYDQFLRWQIAGDLLPGPEAHKRRAALGLFALGPVYYAENVEQAKARADEWDDRVDTLTRGVLGLTVACARCHDHKFDPVTMRDYYGLAGIFASTQYQERPVVDDQVVARRRAADQRVKEQELAIERFLQEKSRDIRPMLTAEIPAYCEAAWRLRLAKRAGEKNDKKLIAGILKSLAQGDDGVKLSGELVGRWQAYLSRAADGKANMLSAIEREVLAPLTELSKRQGSADDLAADVREVGRRLQAAVEQRSERRDELFDAFGADVAFVRPEDRADVPPGVIPLGNLFDDSANVALDAAVASDRYSAVASGDSLGVDRVAQGWGERVRIAPDVHFHFGRLGSTSHSYGAVVNDAWQKGAALSTAGERRSSGRRLEQGIGMHANAMITFDLDALRRAGLLPRTQAFRLKVDRAGINDDALGSNASAHTAVLITRPHRDKAVTDAVLAASVNGRPVEVDVDDFTYYFSGDVGAPLKADGAFVAYDVAVPAEAKHLTLVAAGAGEPADNPISSDHVVFSGARLELDPLPESAAAADDDAPQAAGEADRDDAVLLSRMFYDEGLLALPADESKGRLPGPASDRLKTMQSRQKELAQEAQQIEVLTAHSLTDGDGKDLPVYLQGNPAKQGEPAPRAMPAIFTGGQKAPFDMENGSGRLQLAEAIASADNPLTARVIANRVWAGHFGQGLVQTTSNFGQLGDRPSHPELLDWLASYLIENGWSLKQLHREIMTSRAYQQSSGHHDHADRASELDPENRLVWQMNRRRLEVEPWRDALLAVSGELDRTLGGPSIDLNQGGNRRRTIYGFVSRHRLNELLRLFDFPDPNITAATRSVTTVPLQQLFVLNSDFMAQRAQALAKRIDALQLAGSEERVAAAYRLLFARPPTQRELDLAEAFLSSESSAEDRLSRWEQFALALLSSNEFMFVD